MRVRAPNAFDIAFAGPDGTYTIRFAPIDEWDGMIDVTIGGQAMRWAVLTVDRDDDGRIFLSGPTSGSQRVWNDQYWFELRPDDDPANIRYYGNAVLWREDLAA